MKIIIFLIGAFFSIAALSIPVDFHGYLRSGVGNGLSSNKQKCYNNPGSQGNEFRLGNECSTYGETTFAFDFLDPVQEKSNSTQSFKAQSTFAFFPENNTQYGDEASKNDIDVVETFFEAKNLDGLPYTYWVGKRFYRDVDVHMNDFYYFAAMNGVGAGVKDIPLFSGKFSLAYLQENMKSTSSSDELTKSYLDFRLFDFVLNDNNFLNLWMALGHSPRGQIDSTFYEKAYGGAFGFRIRSNLKNGFNDLALIYGNGVLSTLNVYDNSEIANTKKNDNKYRIRFVDSLSSKLSDRIEFQTSISFEQKNEGYLDSKWLSLGIRPIYVLSKNLKWINQLGYSRVTNSLQTNVLSRVTTALEISPNDSMWARPAIRFFLSETSWNRANQLRFNGKKNDHSIGAQGEAWF